MKKFFILCLMTLVVCVNVNAQNVWEVNYHQADELKGTKGYYSNFYVDTNGNYFVCWSNATYVKIGTSSGIFNYNSDNFVSVIVGFYKDTTLIEKKTTYFYVPDGDSSTAYLRYSYKSRNLSNKIINHLKNVGNVRIIANKYSGANFDIVIPMNPNLICNNIYIGFK